MKVQTNCVICHDGVTIPAGTILKKSDTSIALESVLSNGWGIEVSEDAKPVDVPSDEPPAPVDPPADPAPVPAPAKKTKPHKA